MVDDRLRHSGYGRLDHDRVQNRADRHGRRRDAVDVRNGWLWIERSAIGWDGAPLHRNALDRLPVRAEQGHTERKVERRARWSHLTVAGHAGHGRRLFPRPATVAATRKCASHHSGERDRNELTESFHTASAYLGTTRYSTSPSRIIPNCSRATRSCTAGFVSRSLASLASESSSMRSAATWVRSSASCRRMVIQSALLYSPPHTASASRPTPPARPAMRIRVTTRTDGGRDSAPRLRAPRRCAAADCTSPRARCARRCRS